jgi:aryl-alcohol dehydrogenase-like predicted oxidoreductase
MPVAYDGSNEDAGLSAYKIRRHLDASLHRLETDHIELYQMHHMDTNVTWDELWEVFEALVHQGKIFYVGSSNFAAWYLVFAQNAARLRNMLGLVSEQHKYNLLCRLPELEVLPACKALGIGLTVYSPLHRGILSGRILSQVKGENNVTENNISNGEKYYSQIGEYSKLCRELGYEESHVAIAWLLKNAYVTSVIIGPRTTEQLEKSIGALEIDLDNDAMKKLDEIFPGPGGKAPEAYAW